MHLRLKLKCHECPMALIKAKVCLASLSSSLPYDIKRIVFLEGYF